MATVELTTENFPEVLAADLALVDFWAPWCGPCRMFGPVFDEVSERHPDVLFGTVDTEDQPDLAATFRVMSIPFLLVMRDGLVLYAKPGALSLDALDDLVARARALDMDEVRRSRAARQRSA
ncbi:MAG TPA: thioredoxin domain-containing protein [Pseudonocardiaceae bacterium]|nr:thioredoxin domain-containing protein [Pseudonocardiaceae bacterium]